MSVPAELIVSVITAVCALAAMLNRRPRVTAGALAGTGSSVGILFFLTGEPGLGVATVLATAGVVATGLWCGGAVVRAEDEKEPGRKGAPWLVAFLSSTILVASLALGVAAVDWPPRDPAAALLALPGAGIAILWALVVLGVAAALAAMRLLPRGRKS